ncbi:hypothetical protein HMPREF9162_2211 [Selenomonas sp. oral taxon 137 str. F0430]|nr:hypothetical protein HMPREF9162_2211 [Selenomonas sp. oral taxon 137 str. F0430]
MKLKKLGVREDLKKSRPARGAWIETALIVQRKIVSGVAPRTGRVD